MNSSETSSANNLKLITRNPKLSFLISAGEASGETYGAQIISAIRAIAPEAEFFGLGGDLMREAGCDLVVEARDVAVVGLVEVVSHLPRIYGEFQKLLRAVDERRPTAAILIDFPDFNFRLARKLHARGIPVFYYVSPQLWAWRQGRVDLVRHYVRKMLVIFPFEEQFYQEHGIQAEYVGHPLADLPMPGISRENFAAENGLEADKQWIALLPGSRRKEVEMNLPQMLRAAEVLERSHVSFANVGHQGFEYVLPVAPTIDSGRMKKLIAEIEPNPGFKLTFTRDARSTLAHARAAVVASGTATVEAALIGTPFVVVYRVSGLTWVLGRRFVKVPHFAMPNLIAGREVVPELIQGEFTGERVAAELRRIMEDGPAREMMLCGLAEVKRKLHSPGSQLAAADRAARLIVKELE
jgi:lipid-A-disaccharide synthase